ncbi:MAG TPA: hypothetical protein VKB34_17235 [Povalibacter sp.]|nr:hypothetical protein [Povalibacter sp.]
MNRCFKFLAAFALCVPDVLFAANPPSGPYVTQAMIEQGNVQFLVPNIGTFAIEAIERPPGAATDCHVSLSAVAAGITYRVATGEFTPALGKRTTVWLKKYVFPDGDILCDGAGSDCKVKVKTTSIEPPEVEAP